MVSLNRTEPERLAAEHETRGLRAGSPYASITWIRFIGSVALPRHTLSLCCPRCETTGWLPVI